MLSPRGRHGNLHVQSIRHLALLGDARTASSTYIDELDHRFTMNRQLVLGSRILSIAQEATAPGQLSRSLSSRASIRNRSGSGNASSIGEWLASFNNNTQTVPSSIVKAKHDLSTDKRRSV